jgi:hypothetical protein
MSTALVYFTPNLGLISRTLLALPLMLALKRSKFLLLFFHHGNFPANIVFVGFR